MVAYRTPRRGELWLVSLDPAIGHEIQKTRPAIVVTDDTYNEENWVVSVLPVTSREAASYDQVLLTPPQAGVAHRSVTLPDQIRAVDRRRLMKKLGDVPEPKMRQIDRTIRMVFAV